MIELITENLNTVILCFADESEHRADYSVMFFFFLILDFLFLFVFSCFCSEEQQQEIEFWKKNKLKENDGKLILFI